MVIVVEQFCVFFVRVAGYHLLGRNADTNSDSNIFRQNPLYLPAFRLNKIDNIFLFSDNIWKILEIFPWKLCGLE